MGALKNKCKVGKRYDDLVVVTCPNKGERRKILGDVEEVIDDAGWDYSLTDASHKILIVPYMNRHITAETVAKKIRDKIRRK